MSAKAPRAVAIPGEAKAPEQSQADEVEQIEGDTQQDGEDIDALRAELAAAKAELAKAKAVKAESKQASQPLPTVGGAVKTDKGWVVPETYGTPVKKA